MMLRKNKSRAPINNFTTPCPTNLNAFIGAPTRRNTTIKPPNKAITMIGSKRNSPFLKQPILSKYVQVI